MPTPEPSTRARLADRLGYQFREPALLDRALLHASQARESDGDPLDCNERLEFLGDAVVQLAVSAWLYDHRPDDDEGGLTTARSGVVRGQTLGKLGQALGLGEALTLGRAAEAAGSRTRASVLACTFEAVLGAVFVDGGWEAARDVALALLTPVLEQQRDSRAGNPKGELQELTQERFRVGPVYRLLHVLGPAHDRCFTAEVAVGGQVLGQGRGPSKKAAQEEAARAALARLAAEAGEPAKPAGGQEEAGDRPANTTRRKR